MAENSPLEDVAAAREPALAMIALKSAVDPGPERIAKALQGLWEDAPVLTDTDHKEGVSVLKFGDDTVYAALVDSPIPWSDLEWLCDSAWSWPSAETDLRDHTAHMVLFVNQEGADTLSKALFLSKVVAAAASVTDCIGVYWGSAPLIQPKEFFCETAHEGSMEELPLFLWINFLFKEGDDQIFTIMTLGMETFGLQEIEVRNFRDGHNEMLNLAFETAHYVMLNGPVIEPGHTVGLTEDRFLTVHEGPGTLDPDQRVLFFDMKSEGV